MKTPLNWINIYTPLAQALQSHSITELAHIYSTHTAEIDGIEEARIDKVVIGKVISCEKHPESKKLSICEVQIGPSETTVILTGAPNISEATYVPVATMGAQLSPDFTIGERMMAGHMSRGMICGADEIGLALESDGGIMILESLWDRDLLESMIGVSVYDLTLPFPGRDGSVTHYTLGDTVFEIDNKFITNRPDLFGVYGNAREWGAVFDLQFSEYISRMDIKNYTVLPIKISTNKCLAYHAIKMNDLTATVSPMSLSLMMMRAGLSPRLDLIDITNLILTEFGQPMHVFDADKIQGGIEVRMARPGEILLGLNDIEYTLTPDDIVIADESCPIALAGVIGGKETSVTESTTSVVWESATFDAVTIRLTAQRYGIRTDASTRYEKSLDPLLASFAMSRIFDYLKFLDKTGTVVATSSYLDEKQVKSISIDVTYDFINTKAGTVIEKDQVHDILKKLGFAYTTNDRGLTIQVPSWRASKDISIPEDIAEEVIRIAGYDTIEATPLPGTVAIGSKNVSLSLRDLSLNFWSEHNWHEVYNYSFTNQSLDHGIGLSDMSDAVGIQNAYNVEYSHMRRSLSVRLFDSIANNINNQSSLRFFEIGKVYSKSGQTAVSISDLASSLEAQPYSELPIIAGVSTTDDILSLRRSLEAYLIRVLGYLPPLSQGDETLPFLHPGASGQYHEGDKVYLVFGRVHPETAEAYQIPTDTLYWQADLDLLRATYRDREVSIKPISRYQSIPRELNFILPSDAHTGPIARMIESHHPWIQDVIVDSIYTDPTKVGEGKKSVNFSFILQSNESTISDTEALDIQNRIITLMQEHGYPLRS